MSYILLSALLKDTFWDKIKDKAFTVWKWLLDDPKKSFFTTRLFYALLILAAITILIVFIISKRRSNERERIVTAAVDRLRDEALAEALKKSGEAEAESSDTITEAFLLKLFPKKKTYTVVQINEVSELSKREHIIPIEENDDITIGRSDACSIAMRDRFVAESHCRIIKKGRKLFVKADQTEQPTFLRGIFRIHTLEADKEYRVRKGTKLQIGISLFEINIYRFRITGGYL